ncbi:uncharacterized protein LOC116289772 [Actinia tenebrosa]|uniref:Uncharacterized protein LOC116289772 n=1 Tax=Actinia tenebrosa TaxID=6105 RepID=A0A6P8HBR8_ACTTE|nr:uncharacterized protein LOC116289772 [Actinia tenebrosa]
MENVNSVEIYDYEELEPIANEEEIAEFRIELEEEEMLRRFCGESRQWCTCSNCCLTLVTKQEECFCCNDIMRCMDKLNELDQQVQCITSHPGFESVCLDKYVLETAAVGLKTRGNRSYTILREKGFAKESEY